MTSIYKGTSNRLNGLTYPRVETKRPVGDGCPWCKADRSRVLHTHVEKFTIDRDGRPLGGNEKD
jgi:hypothetical protein